MKFLLLTITILSAFSVSAQTQPLKLKLGNLLVDCKDKTKILFQDTQTYEISFSSDDRGFVKIKSRTPHGPLYSFFDVTREKDGYLLSVFSVLNDQSKQISFINWEAKTAGHDLENPASDLFMDGKQFATAEGCYQHQFVMGTRFQ